MQDVHRARHPIGEVMQARALAEQPGRSDPTVRPVLLGVFGQSETEPRIEVDGVLDLGGKDIEMIEPLRVTSFVEVVAPQEMRTLVHRRMEFDLKTERVGKLQRAALERLLGKAVRDAVLRKERRRLVEILFGADLEAKPIAGGAGRLAQHQRVMLMLLNAAQVYRFVVAVLDVQADGVFVERAARVQVHHVKHGVAAPDDVERRIEGMRRHRHVNLFQSSIFDPRGEEALLSAVSNHEARAVHPSRRGLAPTPQDEESRALHPCAASVFKTPWMLLRFQLVSLSLICMSNDSAHWPVAKTGSR